MPNVVLAIALQLTAPPPAAAPPTPTPQRWSILAPVPEQVCGRKRSDSDITVCGNPLPAQRLPYPKEIGSTGPIASNPEISGTGALAAEATPCPISRTCVVGFGPPIVPVVQGAIDLARKAFAKKPDATGRVAVALDDPPETGKLLP